MEADVERREGGLQDCAVSRDQDVLEAEVADGHERGVEAGTICRIQRLISASLATTTRTILLRFRSIRHVKSNPSLVF